MKKIVIIGLSFLFSFFTAGASKNKFQGKFLGKYLEKRHLGGDSVEMKIFGIDKLISMNEPLAIYTFPIAADGSFSMEFEQTEQIMYHFEFFVKSPTVGLYRKFEKAIFARRFLMETGKDITVNIDFTLSTVLFNGKGCDLLNCQYKINQINLPVDSEYPKEVNEITFADYERENGKLKLNIIAKGTEIASSKEFSISKKIREMIIQDVIAYYKFKFVRALNLQYSVGSKLKKKGVANYFLNDYKLAGSILFNNDSLSNSPWHIEYLLDLERLRLNANKSLKEIPKSFEFLFSNVMSYNGLIRDKLYVSLFVEVSKGNMDEAIRLVPSAIEKMGANWYRVFLINWKNKVSFGSKAIDFQFLDKQGKPVRLGDLKGKVIVMDFWFNGCSGCRQIAPFISKIIDKFDGRKDITFLSISIDKSKKGWLAGLETGEYSDKRQMHLNTGTSGHDHQFLRYYNVLSYPFIMIIGKEGNIVSASPKDPRQDGGYGITNLIEQSL